MNEGKQLPKITPQIEQAVKDFLNSKKNFRQCAEEIHVSKAAFAFVVVSVVRRWVDEGKLVTP